MPDELSLTAAELWEDHGGAISVVHSPGNKGGNSNKYNSRSKSKSGKSNWRQRTSLRSPSPARRQMKDYPSGHRLCVYHWTFWAKATKCSPSCAWTP